MGYMANPVLVQRRVPLFLGCGSRLGDQIDPASGMPILDIPPAVPAPPKPPASSSTFSDWLTSAGWSIDDFFSNATGTPITAHQAAVNAAQQTQAMVKAGATPAAAAPQAATDQQAIAAVVNAPGAFPSTQPAAGEIPTWAWIALALGGFFVVRDLI
jgi:hypothetical protein